MAVSGDSRLTDEALATYAEYLDEEDPEYDEDFDPDDAEYEPWQRITDVIRDLADYHPAA